MKRREIYLESTTQKLGFRLNSVRTWFNEPSERRKKPRREGSACDRSEVTETEEMATEANPLCVNPNFSKRIMGRLSDSTFKDLISAVTGGARREKAEMRRQKTIDLVILRFTGGGSSETREFLKNSL